jgi:hypothetical protein
VDFTAQETVERAVKHQCGAADTWWDCLEEAETLFVLGRQLQTHFVITGRLAAMGDNQILQMKVANIASRTVNIEVVHLKNKKPLAMSEQLLNLKSLNFSVKTMEQPQPAWYTKWYYWTLAGVALSAAITGLAFALSAEDAAAPSPSPAPGGGTWDYRYPLP